MNGLITEGLPLGIPVQILTSGLSFGDVPPTPVHEDSAGLLHLGITAELESEVYYNLPVTSTRISIQVSGTVITSVTINLSNDGITFAALTPITVAGITTVLTNARWIQAVNVGTAVVVKINARREKF